MKLQELTPKGLHSVFETLRTILHSGKIASRVQYMIEVLFAIRKDRFQVRNERTCKVLEFTGVVF